MKKALKTAIEWVVLFIMAWVISMGIRTFVLDTRVVPTGSMLPTIQLQDRIIFDKIFYRFDELQRGDIVMFEAPYDAGEEDDLVKRIVGLPGETIQVKNGKVFIDGEEIHEPYLNEAPAYEFGPLEIPHDSYFMLGDNRNNSKDSHVWGVLPEDNIKGRVFIRYWPLERFGKLE